LHPGDAAPCAHRHRRLDQGGRAEARSLDNRGLQESRDEREGIIYTDPNAPNASGGGTQHILPTPDCLMSSRRRLQEVWRQAASASPKANMKSASSTSAGHRSGVLAGPVPAPLQMYLNYDIAGTQPAAKRGGSVREIRHHARRWHALDCGG
jgi:hypothetical protein